MIVRQEIMSLLVITTYNVLFFQFFNSPVALKNIKKFDPPKKLK